MRRILFLVAAICTIQTASAQVGINNTDPKAQLDISAGATASEMDGLLIPRLDEFPTGVGTDQNGMLVFMTGGGAPTKGFYYWDQGIPAWVPIIGAADTDWTIVGADIERQSGDAYIGDDATTNNKLVISGVIEDWDDTTFSLDPNAESFVKEINYDAGSVTDPSIHFDADTTTGFYRPEADAIGITADGNDKFRFTEQGQLEFYNNGEAVFIGESAGQNDDHMNRQNIAIGYRALRDNVSGARNIAIGSGALFASTGGTANIAIGDDAMVANASGNSNVGLGIQSLYNNISGNNNTALGGTAMRDNTEGSNNTALGFRALYNNTTTNGNVAVGFDAGFENITGTNNTYLGFNAGHLNMGDRSVFIGANSGSNELGSNKLYIENSNADADNALIYGEFDNNILRTNGQFQIGNPSGTGYAFPTVDGTVGQVLTSDGAGNISFATSVSGVEKIDDLLDGKSDSDGTQDGSSIFLGVNAGAADDSSNNRNIGIGYLAMEDNVDGDANTAIGYSALLNNIDGSANTAVGAASLDANTSGIWNTAVGQASLSGNVDGFYNTAVGRSALVNNIDGDSNVAMGVNALGANTTGSFNTVLGVDAANASSDGSSNTVIGRRAMNSHTAGSNNVALGASAGYYGDGIQNTYLGTTAGFSPSSPTRDGSVFVGYGAGSAELTSNKLYIENSTADADNALVYGEFDNNILRTNGELQIGNPTGTGYAFPIVDGAANSVLSTNSTGQLSFVDPSTLVDDDWTDVGPDIERQSGDVYIGDDATTDNDFYISDRIIDWDNSSFYLDPSETSSVDEINFSDGSTSDPSIRFNGDTNTGFFQSENDAISFGASAVEYLKFSPKGQIEFLNTGNSVFIGQNAGNNDDYSNNQNVGVGSSALSSNLDGQYNVGLGQSALQANLSGDRNVGVGYFAGGGITTGQYNVAVGSNTLTATTEGESNIALGYRALTGNIDGDDNIAIGDSALPLATASDNIAIGSNSGQAITSGDRNIGIGYRAQAAHTVGSNNIAIGYTSLDTMNSLTNNSNNVAIGNGSMTNLTEASNNVAIGHLALVGSGNGAPNFADENVAIGTGAGQTNEGNGNVFIGYEAGQLAGVSDNKLYIENSNGDEDNALIYGEFDNNILRTNGELQIGNPTGTGYALPTNQGAANDVLTSNGDGTTQWAAGGATMAQVMANPLHPDGFTGFAPITYQLGGGDYTVPLGKNLYITMYTPLLAANLQINGSIIAVTQNNYDYSKIPNPIIAGDGDVVSTSNQTGVINGYLVDATVAPITQDISSGSYTVPANKHFVILSVSSDSALTSNKAHYLINGETVYFGKGNAYGTNTVGFYGPIFLGEGDIISANNTASLNGYLVDN